MDGKNLAEVIDSIHYGCVGHPNPSQHFMYFIYKEHEMNVPIIGTRFDTYKYVKAVAGHFVEKPQTNCHEYAITHNSSMAWFFSDNLFE
jgi:hypothetical protein